MTTLAVPQSAAESDVPSAPAALARRGLTRRTLAMTFAAALAVAGGGALYLHGLGHESTDDAQVDAEVVAVPARTGGTVAKVMFVENQSVKTGDVLAVLDDDAPRARLAQADANVEAAEAAADADDADARVAETNATGNKAVADASLGTAHASAVTARDQIVEAEAAWRAADAQKKQAQLDRDRVSKLASSGSLSQSTADQAETALSLATANAEAAHARLITLKSGVAQASSRVAEASARARQSSDVGSLVAQARARAKAAHAQVATAKAARDLAALDVGYTVIRAPHDGVVSKKSINEGQTVASGQTVVQLVTPGVWVTANFKETQVEKMRVGQSATVSVDAFPSLVIHGEIESLSGATGSRFTLLPPDNASGNFTKVVQRLPVRVKITDLPAGVSLRPGMSVDLSITTKGLAVATAIASPNALVATPAVNKWAVAVAVAIGALLEIIDTSIVNVALSDMQASLGATLSQVSWVVSSYGIANVIILPLSAWLGDRFGKKSYFVFSLIGFTLASVLCGMATTLPMLVIARVLQGLTGGGLLAKAQSILFETFPKEEQAMAQGFFGAIVIAGPAIGPTLGGYIVTNIGWRWIFFVNVPIGIAAVMLALSVLPRDPEKSGVDAPVDWTAIALLAVGIGSFQTLLEQGNDEDWLESRLIVGLAIASVIGLVAFVRRQLRSDAPVVDLRVLRYRSLWAGSILSVVIGIALYGTLFSIPIFASSVLHYTSQQVGMLLLPGAIASAVAMPIAAKLASKIDPRVLLTGGALVLISALAMLVRLSPSTGGDDLFRPLIVRSVGTVLMFLPLQLAALGPVPREDVASATGFFNLTRQLGGSIGVALLTTLITRREAFHHAVLVEKMAVNDTGTLERVAAYTQLMLSRGFPLAEAKQKALAMLDGAVSLQAAVLSFGDTFWATAALVVVSLPLVLLLGKPPKGMKVSAGH